MAKIYHDRAYIEPYDENDMEILFHVKQGNDHIYAGKVELTRMIPYTYMEYEGDDLIVITSGGREPEIDHILGEILNDRTE